MHKLELLSPTCAAREHRHLTREDLSLHPVVGTPALAGTHTFIIPGFHAHTRKIYALIWASCPRREDTYRLPGGAFGFSRATFVVAALVREVDEATWRWGRVLGQLPAPYLMEWLRAARRALRCQGIAV